MKMWKSKIQENWKTSKYVKIQDILKSTGCELSNVILNVFIASFLDFKEHHEDTSEEYFENCRWGWLLYSTLVCMPFKKLIISSRTCNIWARLRTSTIQTWLKFWKLGRQKQTVFVINYKTYYTLSVFELRASQNAQERTNW